MEIQKYAASCQLLWQPKISPWMQLVCVCSFLQLVAPEKADFCFLGHRKLCFHPSQTPARYHDIFQHTHTETHTCKSGGADYGDLWLIFKRELTLAQASSLPQLPVDIQRVCMPPL